MDSGTESVRKVKTEDSKQKQKIESKNRQQKKVWIDYNEDIVTIQQVCAHAALTVRTHRLESKNPISEADQEWIFARNYEGTEQLQAILKEKGKEPDETEYHYFQSR